MPEAIFFSCVGTKAPPMAKNAVTCLKFFVFFSCVGTTKSRILLLVVKRKFGKTSKNQNIAKVVVDTICFDEAIFMNSIVK